MYVPHCVILFCFAFILSLQWDLHATYAHQQLWHSNAWCTTYAYQVLCSRQQNESVGMTYIIKLVPLQVLLMPFGKQAMLPFTKYGNINPSAGYFRANQSDSTSADNSLSVSSYQHTNVYKIFIERYRISCVY